MRKFISPLIGLSALVIPIRVHAGITEDIIGAIGTSLGSFNIGIERQAGVADYLWITIAPAPIAVVGAAPSSAPIWLS